MPGKVFSVTSSIFNTILFAAGMRVKRSVMFAFTLFQNQLIRCSRSKVVQDEYSGSDGYGVGLARIQDKAPRQT